MNFKTKTLVDARMAHWSGVGRYTCGLVRALDRRDDLDLSVLVSRDASAALGKLKARMLTAEENPLLPAGAREFTRAIESVSYDIVHATHYPMPARRPVPPLVVTLHDLIPLIVPTSMPNPIKRFIYTRKNMRAVEWASTIIVPSQATREDVARLYPKSEKKMQVIAEAADDFVAGECKPPAASEKPYLLAMGNTKAHKNLKLLVAVMTELKKIEPNLELLLVGREDKGWMEFQERSHPEIAKSIRFTGFVSDTELRGLYHNARAVLVPSLYEGFGLPLLEAMGMGAPVLAATTSSLPEVVGDAGMLLDPFDAQAWKEAILRIVSDPAFAQGLSSKGRARFKEFSWDKAAEQTIKTYQSCRP